MKLIIIICCSFLICSCSQKSEAEKTKESLTNTINTYYTEWVKEIDSTMTIDSLKITKIDTLSDRELMAIEVNKVVDTLTRKNAILKAKLAVVQSKRDTYEMWASISSGDNTVFRKDYEGEKEEFDEGLAEAQAINGRLTYLDSMSNLPTVDSTNFAAYGVYSQLCVSDKKLKQDCYPQFIVVSKDFRIKK